MDVRSLYQAREHDPDIQKLMVKRGRTYRVAEADLITLDIFLYARRSEGKSQGASKKARGERARFAKA
jgi:hypothetical protein